MANTKRQRFETRFVGGYGVIIYDGDISYETNKAIARAGTVAVDIETTGPDRESLLQYDRGRPAIVTLYGGSTVTIVRINPMERPSWLCSLLWNADVRKIFHYARFDLSFMMHHWQVRAANVACTRMGAKFCGFEPAQQSLKPQLEYFLNLSLPKTEALSDWTQKTLTNEQIQYAIDDVAHLAKLANAQQAMMREKQVHTDYQAFRDFLPTYVWSEIHGQRPSAYFER